VQPSSGSYLIVVSVPAFRLDDHHFAVESAFAEHLRLLRQKLGALGERMVLMSPAMDPDDYQRMKGSLAIVDERSEGIRHSAAYSAKLGRAAYLRQVHRTMAALTREVQGARVVHSTSSSLYRPFEFPALVMGKALGCTTIFVNDIDARKSPYMNLKTGTWNVKEYLVTQVLHRPYSHLQHLIAARAFSVVLLKGAKLARDYGRGRSNVHDFLDAAFNGDQIIEPARLSQKLERIANARTPVRVGYFGRMARYKGIDHMLRAVRAALDAGANLRFELLGDGPELSALRDLSTQLELDDHVVFRGAVAFGPALFGILHDLDVLLAAPLSEDTPRSALDAMASGQALLAYDTYYYRELSAAGACVELAPWSRAEALGKALAELCVDRPRLGAMMQRNVEFARDNTQDIWLERRVRWTLESAGALPSRSLASTLRASADEPRARKPRPWVAAFRRPGSRNVDRPPQHV
jgi:glycosyltransferase involved in cell wall biosynthesis